MFTLYCFLIEKREALDSVINCEKRVSSRITMFTEENGMNVGESKKRLKKRKKNEIRRREKRYEEKRKDENGSIVSERKRKVR